MGSLVAPRSAVGLGPVPLTVPSSVNTPGGIRGRARGFSAPGSFIGGQVGPHWNQGYGRTPLPPLTVPSDGTPQHQQYTHSPPSEDAHSAYPPSAYPAPPPPAVREPPMYLPSSAYPGTTSHHSAASHWEFPPLNTPAASAAAATPHSGPSLSSLLNHTNVPAGGYGARLSISTHQVQPFSSVSLPTSHSSSSMSPDSRPTTGYSGTSSMSSLPYEPTSPSEDNTRDYDHSTNGRPLTPGSLSRPQSANKGSYTSGSLSIRRGRRHSQAVSPYPSPYEPDTRPLSAPDASLPRAKSLMSLSSTVDSYYMQPAPAEFAYSPAPQDTPQPDAMDGSWGGNRVRPSTSRSSLSAASQGSSSAANTPPTTIESYQETDIHRCEYDHSTRLPTTPRVVARASFDAHFLPPAC